MLGTGFLDQGIWDIAETVKRFYLGNAKGRTMMLKMGRSLAKSAERRAKYEAQGVHIPPFLIGSVASLCNLRCPGCYAWANGACDSSENGTTQPNEMSAGDWRRVFTEASDLGVSFILLAGGEPLLRRDIMEAAAKVPDILFPIFTNGTLIDEGYRSLFREHLNLIPVLSVEGNAETTDARRGQGVWEKINGAMENFRSQRLLFGTSVTVNAFNMEAVTEKAFIEDLREKGCGVVFFVEYVPVEVDTDAFVLSEDQLAALKIRVERLRADERNKGINFLSFPGDEDNMGGCLAAGRGFFHINAHGGMESCPFSPYSEMNFKDHTLMDAIRSPFFRRVREISAAEGAHHQGGCVLFQHKDEMEALIRAL